MASRSKARRSPAPIRSTASGRITRDGVYTTNGAVLSVCLRSSPAAPVPDLFCYGLLSRFRGYFPGYSKRLPKAPNSLTWVVLKAHTNNTGRRA